MPDSSITAWRARSKAALDGHLSHAWIIDGDPVVQGLLSLIESLGLLPQSGVCGRGDESSGLDGRAERAEDPFGDQQRVQVCLTRGV
ncbi:hypothetical protein AMK27_36985 [Streptomyces sp. CB02009]|nr:hypothetical protein AMK27_36985 [Streptomyces sp. CB02009]